MVYKEILPFEDLIKSLTKNLFSLLERSKSQTNQMIRYTMSSRISNIDDIDKALNGSYQFKHEAERIKPLQDIISRARS
jgi:hypothetical protein